jgi:acetate kinase
MGFTPLGRVVMSTRSGSVDRGRVLWLIRSRGMDPAAVEQALERESGLLGLAGAGDMRELLERIERDTNARLTFAVYCHRVRAAAIDGLAFLGVDLDSAQNARATGERDLTSLRPLSVCRTLVVISREDVEIATQVRAALRTT